MAWYHCVRTHTHARTHATTHTPTHVYTCLQVFDRQDVKDSSAGHNCSYRVAQEGVSFLLPHISK